MASNNNNILNILASGFNSGISPEKYFLYKYNKIFHVKTYDVEFEMKQVIKFLEDNLKLTEENYIYKNIYTKNKSVEKTEEDDDYENTDNTEYLIQIENELLLYIEEYEFKFMYSSFAQEKIIEQLIEKIPTGKDKKYTDKFYMVVNSEHDDSLSLKSFKVKKVEVDIKENYNNDFEKTHTEIQNFLEDDKKNGIVMLHGKYGTGKTTYLRHLMKNINKRFIFFPSFLAAQLSSPQLMTFLANFPNSILIMEDCEDILKPRATNTSGEALVNLLNLGDGLLSDALNFKLICTFNAELTKIDPAILRKGRLAVRYEFKALEVEKIKNLSKKHKLKIITEKPMTLAEIFVKKQINSKENKEKRIGFNV